MKQTVTIRNKQQMENMKPYVRQALLDLCKDTNASVPVIYQFLHKEGMLITQEYIEEHTVATASKFHFDKKEGQVIGTIVPKDGIYATLANVFIIDNMVLDAKCDPQGNIKDAQIKTLVVYNMVEKEKIDKKCHEHGATIPLIGDLGKQVELFNVNQDLVKQFTKLAETNLKKKEDSNNE